jgi:uridine kinase
MHIEKPAILIGICGGTGSGKTTLAQRIMAAFDEATVACIQQDSYYRDLSAMPVEERRRVNFDHPDSVDGELLLKHLQDLRSGKSIRRPIYDYTTHLRQGTAVCVAPLPVILVEGLLIFHDERMRRLMDLKIYVDCAADIRCMRRLERDIRERGRSVESVIEQYLSTVRPMHEQFVAPCIRYADIIIPEGGFNDAAVSLIVGKIQSVLRERTPKLGADKILRNIEL